MEFVKRGALIAILLVVAAGSVSACNTTAMSLPPVTLLPTMAQVNVLVRVSEKDGMLQVYVPAGEFWMGSSDADPDADDDEKPQHGVYLDSFWIDRTEVSNAMFAHFTAETDYRTDAEGLGWGRVWTDNGWAKVDGADWEHPRGPATNNHGLDDYPVTLVSWNDASAYCQWAGRRLPTEAQWAKAARGTDGRLYPWGNQPATCEYAVLDDGSGKGCGRGGTAWPVGARPEGVSPYGALDLAGNVWEWVDAWYDGYPGTDYYDVDFGQKHRVLRGGSWSSSPASVRVAQRAISYAPSSSYGDVGFRCAVGVDEQK